MNEPKNDGGAAFPSFTIQRHQPHGTSGTVEEIQVPTQGMSLRDWFAGMALSSMTVTPDYSKGQCNSDIVERAYKIADAMLTERTEP